MGESVRRKEVANQSEDGGGVRYHKRDFWREENLKYARPHYRMQKAARVITRLAGGRERDLLDVGCGPATLMRLLPENIHYYGIDIAIHDPAPYLAESDLLKNPIRFGSRKFDIILAQGFFEYMGTFQSEKFAEIRDLLNDGGRFVVTYVNFGHRNHELYWPYSNVQAMPEFRASLERYFVVERSFPSAHNWRHSEPNRRWLGVPQMYLNISVPVITPWLAVEYFYICTARPGWPRGSGSGSP